MSALDVPGWSKDARPWFDFILPRVPAGGVYLEVGVFLGSSLAYVGHKRPDLHLIAVDPWLDGGGDLASGWDGGGAELAPLIRQHGGLYKAFLATMRLHAPDVLHRTRFVRSCAEELLLSPPSRIAELFPDPVDLLFIDARHTYEDGKRDLFCFEPLVRPSGIVSGHDYSPAFGGIIRAVDESFAKIGRTLSLGTPDGQASTVWWG